MHMILTIPTIPTILLLLQLFALKGCIGKAMPLTVMIKETRVALLIVGKRRELLFSSSIQVSTSNSPITYLITKTEQ